MSKSCFVVMAIGNQTVGSTEIKAEELKGKYDTLIKKAIEDANPELEIVRADEVNDQGTITTDIITKLLFSDFVIVDISHPNPNVYYELGIRHCSRPGTILIKEKGADMHAPFDLSHERYIEYDASLAGLAELTNQLKDKFNWFKNNPDKPDNHVLQYAKNTNFSFPQYGREGELLKNQEEGLKLIIDSLLNSDIVFEALMDALVSHANLQDESVQNIFTAVKKDRKVAHGLISGLINMGVINPQTIANKFLN